MRSKHFFAFLIAFAAVATLAAAASAFYNPSTGTFLQRDPGPSGMMAAPRVGGGPAAGGGFLPRDQYADGMNLYQYVQSNPVRYVDPRGQYGVDVHRSLTTYLAQHAGFNDSGEGGCGNLTPKAVGDNTQLVDDDERKPGWNINLNIHFARPKEVEGHKAKAFQTCDPRDIGTYIHSFEDTFAHQPGETDREQYQRHISPTERRRWHVYQGHLPDYTWRRPDLANKMAEMVFSELQALAKKCCKCASKADDWVTIKGIVDQFNRYKPAEAPWTRWGEMSEGDFRDKVDILFPQSPVSGPGIEVFDYSGPDIEAIDYTGAFRGP